MKVLHVIETLEVGGAEQSLLAILRRATRFQPTMCQVYSGSPLRQAYEAAGIPVISLDVPQRYHFREAEARLERVVSELEPDLIHTTLFRADIVGRRIGRRAGIPVISSFVNESYGAELRKSLSIAARLKLHWVRRLDAKTAKYASHFVAISETIREANSRALKIPVARTSVIYRARDSIRFSPGDRTQSRERLGLPADCPIVLNVARLLPRKGQEELIRAFAQVRKTYPLALLLIAGEGPNRHRLEEVSQQSGVSDAVRFLGTRNDVPDLLNAANVFAFPSHYEGLGGALVEAMFAGKAIVASDTPVHQESISCEDCGILVPPKNVDALATGILRFLANPADADLKGQAARRIALERFDIDRVVAQHEALYDQIVSAWVRRNPRVAGSDRAAPSDVRTKGTTLDGMLL